MRRTVLTTAALALVLGAGACAAKPKPPVAVAATPAPTPTPAPVQTPTPAPTRTVDSGQIPGSVADFTVNVGDRVYFDLDQYRVDSQDQQILQRQAAWLQSYPSVKILVAGNCDERGTREYNLALGERRASVVRDYLVSLGIDPARIETVSYGKERPLATASNEQAWAQNRNGFTQIISGATS